MASRQSCGCSPREKDLLKSVAREPDISSAVILSNFVGMPSYPADFRKSRAERSFLTSSWVVMISFSSLPMMRDTPISGTASVGPETDFWLSEMKKLLNASAFSPSDLATVSFAEIGGSSFFGDDRSDFINLYRFRCGTPVTSPCAVVDTKADLASLSSVVVLLR